MTKPRRAKGSVYRRSDSGVWWIGYSLNGVAFRESSGSTKKKVAEDLLEDRREKGRHGDLAPKAVSLTTVTELAEIFFREYRIQGRASLEHAERRWRKHLQPFFGIYRAAQVGPTTIDAYIDRRRVQGAACATINRELAIVRHAYRLGREKGKVSQVPVIHMLPEPKGRQGFLEDAQYRELVKHCPALWLRTMLEIGKVYGWRSGEVKTLRVRQVDLLHRTISLAAGSTKNGEGRTVSMTDAVYTLLAECIQGKKPDDFVFTRADGKPVLSFRVAWKNLCRDAGCPGLLFHDLRRTAAMNLRRAKVPEGVIMKIGGWKTRKIFDRYNITTQDDIVDALDRLQESEKQRAENLTHVSRTIERKTNTVVSRQVQ